MNQKGFALIQIILGIILILGLIAGSYYLGLLRVSSNVLSVPQTDSVSTAKLSSPDSKNMINLNSTYPNDESLKYFTVQLIAPNVYFATDDSTVTPYDTQGGMAPPRLILMKNYQALLKVGSTYIETIHNTITQDSKNDCIVIWSTNGETSIDGWNSSVTQFSGQLLDKQQIAVGSRQATSYLMKKTGGDIYEAYLPIGNKDETSYYFHTCNTNNKSDFINVIKSIKFRGDLVF